MNKERLEVYRNLIQELLSCPDDQKWELLQAHQELLNSDLIQIMQNKLAKANPDEAKSIAADIVNFSNLIAQFPLGDKASNMEIAIKGHKVALTVRTREAFPIDWAATQNDLAVAYWYRIWGEKAENLESAIAALQKSLGVYTREAFPVYWAMTQNNLGRLQ